MAQQVLDSSTGASLAVRFWPAASATTPTDHPAAGTVRGTVLVFHGLAEHGGRYEGLAAKLSAKGFDVYAHDHRGHGATTARDAPPRRFAKDDGMAKVLADCRAVQVHAAARRPGLPIMVLGHSMGGLIAVNYAERFGSDLAGVAVWNANLRVGAAERVATIALSVEKALKGSDVPSAILQRATFDAWAKSVTSRRTPFDWLSHDPAAVDAYIADPLSGFSPTLSMMQDILALIFAGGSAAGLARLPHRLPVQLLGGTADPATDNAGAMRWLADRLRAAGLRDVTLTVVEGARHETHHEIEPFRSQAFDALSAWLDRIVPGNALD